MDKSSKRYRDERDRDPSSKEHRDRDHKHVYRDKDRDSESHDLNRLNGSDRGTTRDKHNSSSRRDDREGSRDRESKREYRDEIRDRSELSHEPRSDQKSSSRRDERDRSYDDLRDERGVFHDGRDVKREVSYDERDNKEFEAGRKREKRIDSEGRVIDREKRTKVSEEKKEERERRIFGDKIEVEEDEVVNVDNRLHSSKGKVKKEVCDGPSGGITVNGGHTTEKFQRDDDSFGLRHTRTRGINASVCRERDAARQREERGAQHVEPGSAQQGEHMELDEMMHTSRRDTVQMRPETMQSFGLVMQSPAFMFHSSGQRQQSTSYMHQSSGHRQPSPLDFDNDDEASLDDEHDPTIIGHVRKDKRGRFDTIASTSTGGRSRSRASYDSWRVEGPVPGGPVDDSVIPSFLGHVAYLMWDGQFRSLLKCQNRLNLCTKLRLWYDHNDSAAIRVIIDQTRLGHLRHTMFEHVDTPLISAFIERWQPDTNTFHMPFGEMTVMLHDVWHILRIPVEGAIVDSDMSTDDLQDLCMEVLGVDRETLLRQHYLGGGVYSESIISLCNNGRTPETEATAWLWLLLGGTLFVDKSGNRVRPACLQELGDSLEGMHSYSWGSATLAYLYRQLGIASRGDCQGMSGCLTLLQAWIYEYFPCLRPHRVHISSVDMPRACIWSVGVPDRSEGRLLMLRRRLDGLTAGDVMWMPYGSDPAPDVVVPRTTYSGWLAYRDVVEPYMPARVLRQLGFVQTVPRAIFRPTKAIRPWCSKSYKVEQSALLATDQWDNFPESCSLALNRYALITVNPGASSDSYDEWYVRHSHPRLFNGAAVPEFGIPSRSNSEYWVTRLGAITQSALSKLPDEEAEEDIIAFQKFIADWTSAT